MSQTRPRAAKQERQARRPPSRPRQEAQPAAAQPPPSPSHVPPAGTLVQSNRAAMPASRSTPPQRGQANVYSAREEPGTKKSSRPTQSRGNEFVPRIVRSVRVQCRLRAASATAVTSGNQRYCVYARHSRRRRVAGRYSVEPAPRARGKCACVSASDTRRCRDNFCITLKRSRKPPPHLCMLPLPPLSRPAANRVFGQSPLVYVVRRVTVAAAYRLCVKGCWKVVRWCGAQVAVQV